MKWINAFLCYRQQRVVENGVKSDWAPVVSGVPQGTVLGPLLFSLHINVITADIESEIRLFVKLLRDIDRLGNWARKWGMRFQPVKCNMMQLTRKHLNKIQASYSLEGAVLENVDNIKYLGVTITNDLKWNTHISNICTKANRSLGFLRRTLFSCPQNVKEAAYKGMVRQILEYGSSVWDPHTDKLQDELENVQNRVARFVTRNYVYETGSMTGILGQLKWESLKKRRKDNRLIVVVVCRLHYINTLKQELNGTKVYEETSIDEKSVVYSHSNEIPNKFAVDVKERQDRLPTMYWLPKLHKRPYKGVWKLGLGPPS